VPLNNQISVHIVQTWSRVAKFLSYFHLSIDLGRESVIIKCLNFLFLLFLCQTSSYQLIHNTNDDHPNINIRINLVLLSPDFSMVSFSIMSVPNEVYSRNALFHSNSYAITEILLKMALNTINHHLIVIAYIL